MRRIQDQTAAEFPDVRFVSFTVDPAHDTPPVLAEYAEAAISGTPTAGSFSPATRPPYTKSA